MIQLTKEKLDQYDQRTIGELAELAAPALRHRQACWRPLWGTMKQGKGL